MNYISDAKVYPDLEPNEICLIYAASPAKRGKITPLLQPQEGGP